MNTQIKSHWKLAFRTFLKAVKVTLQTIAEAHRAHQYRVKIAPDLRSKKDFFAQLDIE